MSIYDSKPRKTYAVGATAQAAFAVPFVFWKATDLRVYVDDALLTSGYTVTGGNGAGGTVTLATPVSNTTVAVVRRLKIERTTDFPNAGPLKTAAVNRQFDQQVAILQQLDDDGARSLKLPETEDPEGASLPALAARAGRVLGFDADGRPTVSTSSIAQLDALTLAALQAGKVAEVIEPFEADGETSTITTTAPLVAAAQVTLLVGGIVQTPQSGAYTVSGNTITMAEAPPAGVRVGGFVGYAAEVAGDALTAIQGTTPAADRLPYFTGEATAGTTAFPAFARSLLAGASAAAMRSTMGALATNGDGSALQVKSTTGTTFFPLSAFFDFVIRPELRGAVGDGATDNRVAIQKAFDDAAAAGPGAIVEFGPGCFVVSGPLYVRAGMVIRGSGRGALPTSNGGTTLRASYGNADIISIQSDGGVTIRDMCIDAAGQVCTAGAAIRVAGIGSAAESQNRPSAFEGLYLKEVWDGIVINDAQNYHVSGNHIFNYKNIGIDINPVLGTGDTADTNGGQAHIIGNTIQDLSGSYDSAANIRYCNGGDVRIIGNKLIGGARGVWLYLTAGPTGTLIVQGNSIEQHSTNSVVAEQATSGAMFGSLMVENNQFLDIDTTPSAMIEVKAGTATGGEWVDKWINLVQVMGNCIGMALPADTVSYGVLVNDGAGVNVSHNIIHALDLAGPKGIKIGSGASSVQIAGNVGIRIPSGLYDTLPSGVSVQDVDVSSGAWRTFRNGAGVLAKMDDLANGVEVVIGSDGTDAYIGSNNVGSKTRLLAGATEVLRLQNSGAGRYIYIKSSETGNCAIGSNQNEVDLEGASLLPWVDNTVTIGKSGQRWASVWAANGSIQTSDSRQKTDDINLDGAKCWDFLSRLRPLVFRWIIGGRDAAWDDESQSWTVTERPGVRRHAGFFAQEVRQALEESGLEITGLWVEDRETGEQGLRSDQMLPYVVAGLLWRDGQREDRIAALERAVSALSGTGGGI